MRRMSVATAASVEGNPNTKFWEDEETKLRLSNAIYRKGLIVSAKPKSLSVTSQRDRGSSGESESISLHEPEPEEILKSGTPILENIPLPEFEAEPVTEPVEAPETLIDTDQFFITKGGTDFMEVFGIKMTHMYGLLNGLGERLFFVSETQEEFAGAYTSHRSFDLTVLQKQGGIFFEIIGNTNKDAIVKKNDTIVGTVSKSYFGLTYYVKNSANTLFKFSPIGAKPGEYEICAIGFSEPCGTIKEKWFMETDPKLQTMYGMTIPRNLNYSSKLLLLSTFIILYFYFFQPVSRGENRKRFWQTFGFSAGVAVVITIMILIIFIQVILK